RQRAEVTSLELPALAIQRLGLGDLFAQLVHGVGEGLLVLAQAEDERVRGVGLRRARCSILGARLRGLGSRRSRGRGGTGGVTYPSALRETLARELIGLLAHRFEARRELSTVGVERAARHDR